jgi:multiple sugar transport system permease protein
MINLLPRRWRLGRLQRLKQREAALGYVLILIVVGWLGLFIFYPISYNFFISFRNKSLLSPSSSFVGLQTYMGVLRDPEFWSSLWISLVWTLTSVFLQILLGTAVALLINCEFRGKGPVRGLTLLPYVIPMVIVSAVWRWMFHDLYGFFNLILQEVGLIKQPIIWLGSRGPAMFSLILVTVWCRFPFVAILVLAALQMIPQAQYEAATVDGTSRWQRFIYVTLPNLKPTLAVITILRIIWTFNHIELPLLLTGGGPAKSTQTYPILVYMRGFQVFRVSEASCISILVIIPLVILIILYFKVLKPEF